MSTSAETPLDLEAAQREALPALLRHAATLGAHVDVSLSPADAGAALVRHYGDVKAEVHAARAHAAMFDLSHRGALAVRGRDRVRFLQSMSTNDLGRRAAGEGVYLVFLNDKGRVVADALASVFEEEVWLDVEAAARHKLPALFDGFIITDDVEVTDRTDDRALLGVYGPAALSAVQSALGVTLDPRPELAHREVGGVHVSTHERPGVPGLLLRTAAADAPALHDALAKAGVTPAGADAADTLRIEAGVPRAFVDADESTILLEAGLEHAASREKGCYLGQEVIVRAQDRGGIRKQLRGLIVDGDAPPARGAAVTLGDRDVGRVTSAVWSPTLARVVALGIVHKDAWPQGLTLSVEGRAAHVTPLPFVPEAR